MAFSWQQIKLDVIELKIRRGITQAKASHPDFKINHQQEYKDAQLKKYSNLTSRVKGEIERYQDRAIQRRLRYAGK